MEDNELSRRIMGIKPSATLAVDAKAKELNNQGKNVISFGFGGTGFYFPTSF
jgi:aspartate aminotransferase